MHSTWTAAALSLLLLAGCTSGTPTESSGSPAVQAQLATQEAAKWDLTFGSAQDREAALAMYAQDYLSVGYGPAGVMRATRAEVAQGLSTFPVLPRGSFAVSDMRVVRAADDGIVLSYRITGPGPAGPRWSAYAVSIWARRGDEWKTVFYQATELP